MGGGVLSLVLVGKLLALPWETPPLSLLYLV